jgi:hypothetical protein
MKKLILILTIATLISCSSSQIKDRNFDTKVAELIETGYTLNSAVLIAKVELGYIKPNREYNALIND